MTESLKLKIGHRKFRVVPFDTVDGPNAGLIDFEAQTISLAIDVSPEEQARVLIHELLHAAWEMAGAGKTLTEEAVCETLDGPLAAIFSDNPHIFGVLRLALNHGEAIVALPVDGVKETPFSSLPGKAKVPTHLEAWAAWGKQAKAAVAFEQQACDENVQSYLKAWGAFGSSSLAMHNANVKAQQATPQPSYQQDERFFDYIKFGGPPALSACNND